MIREDRRYEIRYDKMIREEERQADRTIHHSCSDQHNDNNTWSKAARPNAAAGTRHPPTRN